MEDTGGPQLTLVVLRVSDLAASRSFYEGIGLVMRVEQHGQGPRHLSAVAGPTVFELYPIGSGPPSSGTRIGWSVSDLDLVLAGRSDAIHVRDGRRLAVLVDPDGHKVELTEHIGSIPAPAERMANACRQLVDVVENTESSLADLHGALIGVLAAVQDVPAAEPTSFDAVADPPAPVEASKVAARNVAAIVGSSDYYRTVLNSGLAEEPSVGSLVDDVVDIYLDLGRGLELFDAGAVSDALWEWRFSYRTHWGRHATEAIRRLHQLAEVEP